MVDNNLGKLRRSTVIMTGGPGSVVDFRVDDGPVSAVVSGLEQWDTAFPPAGLNNPQKISEPRLEKQLSVQGFRLPPVVYERKWDHKDGKSDDRSLVAVRFPEWLQCPECKRIALASEWDKSSSHAYRLCPQCTYRAPGKRNVFVVPCPFVVACEKGHLDEFPWHWWVRHKPDCNNNGEQGSLYLISKGAGLAGLILECRECRAQQSMEGIFGAEALILRKITCRGRRPWLISKNESCNSEPRVLQRAASNLYFPVIRSALSIPPWSDTLKEDLGDSWSSIVSVKPENRAIIISMLAEGDQKKKIELIYLKYGISTTEQLVERIENQIKRENDRVSLSIREEEYRKLVENTTDTEGKTSHGEFEIRVEKNLPSSLQPFLSRVVRVVRLREVRALVGFTRINPPGDEESLYMAPLSSSRRNWLPAIEVRGEGIFLEFNHDQLHVWETNSDIKKRADGVDQAWQREWARRYKEGKPAQKITARYLLVHTFAHALMRRLALECGYSTASLRERLYVCNGNLDMAGLLIYTATSDSDGTLGGLQRQGEATRIQQVIKSAIQMMQWCSSDPLCILENYGVDDSDRLSLAACHACVFAPETACEQYNQFLDRSVLVGLPDQPEIGFFSSLLHGT